VQARTGPDGALYIVDMYRFVIEHPRWIPPEELAQVDVRAGYNMGRIYRIYHKDRPPRPIKRLDKLDTAGLVAALDSRNGPQRDMAMQMLEWKQDKSVIPALHQLLANKHPEVQLSALCSLGQLQALQPDTILKALKDEDLSVRRHAVRLCENGTPLNDSVRSKVFLKILDPDSKVLLQTAYALGERRLGDGNITGELLGCLILDGPDDPYLQAAILSSLNKSSIGPFLVRIFGGTDKKPRQPGMLAAVALSQAGHLADMHTLREIVESLYIHQGENFKAWQFAALAELADSLEKEGETIEKVFDSDRTKGAVEFFDEARKHAVNPKAEEELRIASLRLLGRQAARRAADIQILEKLIDPQQSLTIQTASIAALMRMNDRAVPDQLLANWTRLSPAIRIQVLDALMTRDVWLRELIATIEKGRLHPGDFDVARRQRLLQHKNKAIRDRASKLLAGTISADRKKVLDDYQSVTSALGDKARGKDIFAKRCATCHKLDGVGHEVGPDLGQMANKSPQAFLIAILDPNQAVDARYLQYIAATKDGRQYIGILASETATSITIREHDGKDWVLLRTELEALESTGKSLMPEGLEKDVNKQEMADLIAYLTANAPPAKKVAGNQPVIVKPAADGLLRLLATNCEIHGGEITFESDFKNIGMWHGQNDHVAWSVELDKPTSYDVYLDWACADSSAGNVLVLEVAGKTLRHRVAGTGGDWSNYKLTRIGTITIRDGTQKIVVRPETKPQGALCDLRALILVKEGGKEPKSGE
jgi:putative heme-binding domain-containing protein